MVVILPSNKSLNQTGIVSVCFLMFQCAAG